MNERPLAFYPRLSRFIVEDVLQERGKDVRAIILFGRLTIMWDAPTDRDRGAA